MARRNIAARLVLDSNGVWTLVEDTTVNRPQPVFESQTQKTTGSDDKVTFFGNQTSLPVQISDTTSNMNSSQLSVSGAKLISTIACTIQPKTTDKPPTVSQHISSINVAPQVKAAGFSDPGLKHGYLMKPPNDMISKSNTQISNPLQVNVPQRQGVATGISYDVLPRLLNEALQSQVELPGTSGSGCSGSTALTSITMKPKPQQQCSGSAQVPTVIHVPSRTESKIKFDLSSFGKSILKNPVVQSSVQPVVQPQVQPVVQPQLQPVVQPQVQQVDQSQVHPTAPQSISVSRSVNTGVYVGTFPIENKVQSPATQQKKNNIVPILSKYATHLTNTSNSLNLQGNARHVNVQAQLNKTDNQQLLILHPKPVATVKPEPAKPLHQNPNIPVVSTSYVAMVPTGVPTYYHPVILNEPEIKSPPVAKTPLATQRQDENTSSLKPTPHGTKPQSPVLTVPIATITPQKPSPGKEIFLPEVCEEVVVESAQTDIQEGPLPRIESVFSLTHTEDADTADEKPEEIIDDHVSLTERADDEPDLNSSYDSESGKRRRKKPKRLITEDFNLPLRRCSSKKKAFLKPVVFNPCFVVLERIVTDGNKNTQKKAKGKKGKQESDQTCTKICRERFLQRLCWKRSIPCNRYLEDSEDVKKMCIEHKYCKKQKQSTAGNLRLVMDDGTCNVSSHFERNTFRKQPNQKGHQNKNNNNQNTVFDNNYGSIPNVFSVPSQKKRRKCRVSTATCDVDVTGDVNSFVNVSSSVSSSVDQDPNLLRAEVEVSARVGSASKYTLSIPKSPSSETESALSESYIASEVESSPAKDLISVDSGTLPEYMSDSEVMANDEDETASTEGHQERSPSPEEPTEETDIDSPRKTPSPNPYQEIEDLLNQEYDQTRTEQAAKEDSDDDWGTNELEVDPDSDPDEGSSPSNVPSTVPSSLLPCSVSESVLDKEEPPEIDSKDNDNEPFPLRTPVLSERVQRLKEMLAEQSRQVDNLRRLRRRTK